MSRSWSNGETFKFIELYQAEPIIWDPQHFEHKDRVKVHDAWKRIADELEIPVTELKKKKETLMASFRVHFKKKLESIRYSLGEDDIYKPIWMYYEPLESFLKDVYECRSVVTDEANVPSPGEETIVEDEEETEIPIKASKISTDEHKLKIAVQRQRRRSVRSPELPNAEQKVANILDALSHHLANSNKNKTKEDECELFGRLVTLKLRKYSESEREEIMYEIDGLFLKRRRRGKYAVSGDTSDDQ